MLFSKKYYFLNLVPFAWVFQINCPIPAPGGRFFFYIYTAGHFAPGPVLFPPSPVVGVQGRHQAGGVPEPDRRR